MKTYLWGVAALVLVAAGPATAGDGPGKPIDTKSLIVKPTRAVADLTAQTISMAGQVAANQVEKDGFFKTFNNLFRNPTPTTKQVGGLPAPHLYPSTQYKSYNTPVMPINSRR